MIVASDLLKPNRQIWLAIWLFAWPLVIWVAFWPYPYYLAIGVASSFIPLLLLLVAFFGRDRFQLSASNRPVGIRIELSSPLLAVVMALAWRALCDFRTSSYAENDLRFLFWLAPISVVISLLIVAAIKKASFFAALFLSIFYAFPLINHANTVGPVASKTSFSGTVIRKYPTYKFSGYSVVVSVNNAEKHVKVSEKLYDDLRIGDIACGTEAEGWLGLYIRDATRCEHP